MHSTEALQSLKDKDDAESRRLEVTLMHYY